MGKPIFLPPGKLWLADALNRLVKLRHSEAVFGTEAKQPAAIRQERVAPARELLAALSGVRLSAAILDRYGNFHPVLGRDWLTDTALQAILSDRRFTCKPYWNSGRPDSDSPRDGYLVLDEAAFDAWAAPAAPLVLAPVDSLKSGGAGRPTPMHLVREELVRRARRGERHPTGLAYAQALSDWLRAEHPGRPHLTAKAIQNSLRREIRGALASVNE